MAPTNDTAALVAIGDELLAGAHPDLNTPHLAFALAEHGLSVGEACVLGDDEDALAERFAALAERHALVITTGGLGPTLDDVTRHAAARAAGAELELSRATADALAAWFAQQGREMAPANERQALFPQGATILANAHGTAPGFRVRAASGAWLVCLPGPPPELQGMTADTLVPWLVDEGLARPVPSVRTFYLVGLPESTFADHAGDWMARDANPVLGVTAKRGTLAVRLRALGAGAEATAILEARAAEFRERFAASIYSEDQPRLELVLGSALIAAGRRVATAESCTGGLVAHMLSRAPGISAVFSGGFVTYSNELKVAQLGVDARLLERHGAVSDEVAAAMAEGAARSAGAELTVSTTGIAGPDGGSEAKPVGRVHFGVWDRGKVTTSVRSYPPIGREAVQHFAATAALDLLRRALGD